MSIVSGATTSRSRPTLRETLLRIARVAVPSLMLLYLPLNLLLASLIIRLASLHTADWILMSVFFGGGLGVMALTGGPWLWFGDLQPLVLRAKGERLLKAAWRDERPPFVAIHSYSDDSDWRAAFGTGWFTRRSSGHGVVDLHKFSGLTPGIKYQRNIITEFTAAADSIGSTMIVGSGYGMTDPVVPFIKLTTSDEHWRRVVTLTLTASRAILLFPGDSPGLEWELDVLLKQGLYSKTIVVMRPIANHQQFVEYDEKNRRDVWRRRQMRYANLRLPDYDPLGVMYIPNADLSVSHAVSLQGNDRAANLRDALTRLLPLLSGRSQPLRALLPLVSAAGATASILGASLSSTPQLSDPPGSGHNEDAR